MEKFGTHIPFKWTENNEIIEATIPLEGSALVEAVKGLEGAYSPRDLARLFGYTTQGFRPNVPALNQAVLDGMGFFSKQSRPGPRTTGTLKVTGTGNLILGKSALDRLGVKPGERFLYRAQEIEGKRCIVLVPLGKSGGVANEQQD
jgi:hypothetical protein